MIGSCFEVNAENFLEVLSDYQCEKILSSAVEVLERTGVIFNNNEAIDLLKNYGCSVDGNRVCIQSALVEKSLNTVPKQLILYNSRNGEPAVKINKNNIYFGADCNTDYFMDFISQKKVESNTETLKNVNKIVDAADNIDFIVNSNNEVGGLQEQFADQLLNLSKPVFINTSNRDDYLLYIKMGSAVLGCMEELKKRPFISFIIDSETPFNYNNNLIESLLMISRKSLPLIFSSSVKAGENVPVTLAGTLVSALANCLAALVLNQIVNEGNPFVIGGNFSTVNLQKNNISHSTSQTYLLKCAFTDIAHYLNLPVFNTCSITDSKIVDEQAAIDNAMSIMTAAQAGTNLSSLGFNKKNNISSLENIVVCDDLIGMVKRIIKGINVNEDTLALDVIDEVGPGSHFLNHKHTLEYFKKVTWYPELFQRKRYNNWLNEGKKTLYERAHDKVQKVVKNYTPEPLAKDIKKRLISVKK